MDVDARETLKRARQALSRAHQEPVGRHFDRLVRMGLIDRKGRVTRLYGGKARLAVQRRSMASKRKRSG